MAQFYADRISLGSHRAKTPEGYLLCKDVPFARTGFQLYKASELGLPGDKKVKVYRRFDEVFHPATLASFEGKTVTSPHPPIFLNPDNDAAYYKGHIQNVRQGDKLSDGEFPLLGDILIKDSRLIAQVESGSLSELSAGYLCAYEPDDHTPDVFYQTEIRGNHVAVVPTGRAGNTVKILDAKEEAVGDTPNDVADDRVSVGAIATIVRLLGLSRPTVDSDSEAVERNEKINKEAKERAVKRNEDEEKEEKKKTEDAADKKIVDAVRSAVKDAMDEFQKKEEEKEKREQKDADEKKADEEKKKKEESEDSDLIPVATLAAGDRPKNPIPGADHAVDSARALASLMSIKTLVADSGTKEDKEAWNDAVRAVKGKKTGTSDGYRELLSPSDKVAKDAAERATARVPMADGVAAADDFVAMAEHYRGKNPSEAAATLAEARNKGGK